MKHPVFVRTALSVRSACIAGAILAGVVACGGGYGNSSMDHTPMPTIPVASASKFAATNLVSDGTISAAHTDAKLINAWGVAFNPTGVVWVNDNGSNFST
jgi:hypothetical protein